LILLTIFALAASALTVVASGCNPGRQGAGRSEIVGFWTLKKAVDPGTEPPLESESRIFEIRNDGTLYLLEPNTAIRMGSLPDLKTPGTLVMDPDFTARQIDEYSTLLKHSTLADVDEAVRAQRYVVRQLTGDRLEVARVWTGLTRLIEREIKASKVERAEFGTVKADSKDLPTEPGQPAEEDEQEIQSQTLRRAPKEIGEARWKRIRDGV
jgi:hypothetical protein